MKKILTIVIIIVATLVLGFSGFVGWTLYPHKNPQPLPASLVAATSVAGMERLANAEALADYRQLSESFQPQSLISYCGVATSVSVLAALGIPVTQGDFFTDQTRRIRSQFKVMFGGMSLVDLAGLLQAHGLHTSVKHADHSNIAAFRATVAENLANHNDYLIVNYQREALGQGKVGHISPISAYDRETDSVLVMDTAAHKYPPTWVPITALYAAMRTTDPDSQKMRGYLEVSKNN